MISVSRIYVSVQELCGSAVLCRDGAVGKVSDIILSRSTWCARYAVVDLEIEMGAGRVLLPLTGNEAVDILRRQLRTDQPASELEWAPTYDSPRPLTRNQEKILSRRCGWPSEWIASPDRPIFTAALPQFRETPFAPHDGELELMLCDSPETQSATHLIAAFTASGSDERPISIQTLIINAGDWRIPYMAAKCGPTARAAVLPATAISAIDWLHKHIYLACDAEMIARAPRFQPQIAARAAMTRRLNEYYEEPLQTNENDTQDRMAGTPVLQKLDS